jgi:hypothetical protein
VSEIRSFRSVFDLERRIYRIDRVRLNPGGIPVRGILYFLAALLALTLTARVPLLGEPLRILPWYGRDFALPGLCAGLLAVIRVEGRPFHLAALAVLRYAQGPRHLAGLQPCGRPGARWLMEDLLVLPDGSEANTRRLRYAGPGAVRRPASGKVLVLERGAWLHIG